MCSKYYQDIWAYCLHLIIKVIKAGTSKFDLLCRFLAHYCTKRILKCSQCKHSCPNLWLIRVLCTKGGHENLEPLFSWGYGVSTMKWGFSNLCEHEIWKFPSSMSGWWRSRLSPDAGQLGFIRTRIQLENFKEVASMRILLQINFQTCKVAL